jgi:small subunit ribosomal protein S8e
MTQWQLSPKKKITGGYIKRHGKKTRQQRGRDFLPAHIGEDRVKEIRVRGGNTKRVILKVSKANIMVNGKHVMAKIISVSANPADSQFVRRNIITKGAIIETDAGTARVTSRPGQSGVINAVMIEKSEAKPSRKKK